MVSVYLCVYNEDSHTFICAGTIQGPQGTPGQSSYVYVRYATDANGSGITKTPNSSTAYIGVCVSTSTSEPAATAYTWSKFVGDSAKSIILNGTSQIFKVTQGTTQTYSPTTIAITTQVVNTTVIKWEYSSNGGGDWTEVKPDCVKFDSDTKLIITGSGLSSNSLVIRASNGDYSDTYTVYKVFDGANGSNGAKGDAASMAFLTNENISFAANANGEVAGQSFTTKVVSYNGTTKNTPVLGAIIGLPTGMTVVPNKGTAYSSTTPTTTNLTVTDLYTNNTLTTKVAKTLLSNGDSFVVGNYLYKYDLANNNFKCDTFVSEGTTYLNTIVTNNEVMLTFTIADKATLGATTSINNIVTPSINNSISIPVTSPVSTNVQLSWIKINTGATGAPGSNGADAYTVLLTNESHTFAGGVSSAVASEATTQIIAYKGSSEQSVKIKSVNGVTAGIIETPTNIPGLTFKCSSFKLPQREKA